MRFSPDQLTTALSIVAAARIYFTAQGWLDAHTATFLDAVLTIAIGYYTNRKV